MIKRTLATLAIAATIGTAVAACNSYPASSTMPSYSTAPMASPSASDPMLVSPSFSAEPSPMQSVAPSAS